MYKQAEFTIKSMYDYQVIGDRVVTYADRSELPYINATLTEIHRLAVISRLPYTLFCMDIPIRLKENNNTTMYSKCYDGH